MKLLFQLFLALHIPQSLVCSHVWICNPVWERIVFAGRSLASWENCKSIRMNKKERRSNDFSLLTRRHCNYTLHLPFGSLYLSVLSLPFEFFTFPKQTLSHPLNTWLLILKLTSSPPTAIHIMLFYTSIYFLFIHAVCLRVVGSDPRETQKLKRRRLASKPHAAYRVPPTPRLYLLLCSRMSILWFILSKAWFFRINLLPFHLSYVFTIESSRCHILGPTETREIYK